MRQRSISAVGVVIVGILPALMGGPIFALTIVILCLIGLNEYNAMSAKVGKIPFLTGYVAVPGFALAAMTGAGAEALLGVCALAIGAPLIWALFRADLDRAFVDWSLAVAGSLYLGLPVYAAISLRSTDGVVSREWITDLSDRLALGWDSDARGLAWFFTVLIITWLGDTGAYLVGRSFGKHPMIPRISPKKTLEGLAGGLASAALTGVVASIVFGLELPIWVAAGVGLVVGVVGVFGDLVESLLKRQAGVKDSGTLIPGHGGMLDRLDAMLFTLTAGWFIATFVDRVV